MQGPTPAPQQFAPGDRAPRSGVYRTTHAGHRPEHFVTIFRGDTFPRCAQCGAQVRYVLQQGADGIREDRDFQPD